MRAIWRGISGSVDDGEGPLSHLAFLYRDPDEYLACVLPFIQEGLASAEPVFVAVPGDLVRLMPAGLWAADGQVTVADMRELGRNPARITLALGIFAGRYPGQRIRIVTEPLWPGRSAAESAEVMRHEALVRLALSGVPAQILCPYDVSRLSPLLIAGACHTHAEIIGRGLRRPSSSYRAGVGAMPQPRLPSPPGSAQSLSYRSELASVRALVGRCAERAGLPAGRRADLVLAVSEIAANTLRHTSGPGTVHVWAAGQEILCQLHDHGWITDPLAGRRRPPPDSSGQGLWVVNHVCDLVEMRSGPAGTTILLRMRLPAPDSSLAAPGTPAG